MTFAVFANLFSMLLDLLGLCVRSDREKDLEILVLRQQLRILQRTRSRPPRLSWWEKLPLVLLAAKLVQGARSSRARLSQSLLLFTPETVLRWHRELVRCKWTFPHKRTVGRPRIAEELETLIVRMAKENPRWGVQQNRRRTAQARLPHWAHDHSRRPQTPASSCRTFACPSPSRHCSADS